MDPNKGTNFEFEVSNVLSTELIHLAAALRVAPEKISLGVRKTKKGELTYALIVNGSQIFANFPLATVKKWCRRATDLNDQSETVTNFRKRVQEAAGSDS